MQRRGEKIGWTAGWLGGFLWLCLLSVLWLAQGRIAGGVAGLVLFAGALVLIVALRPWTRPSTRYWKLMLPMYAMLAASLALCVWIGGEPKGLGLSWRQLPWLMPLMIPFATAGPRRWKDGDAGPACGAEAASARRRPEDPD